MMSLEKKNSTDTNNYKNIVENLPVAVIIFTPEGKVLYTNSKTLDLFGVDKNETDSKNIFDFVSPQFVKIIEERKKNILLGKELPSVEIEVKNTKGETIFVEIKTSSVMYNELPAMQTIITDITTSKQLQEEKIRAQVAEETNQSLKKEVDLRTRSEQKLRAIFESGTQLMWTVNKNIALTSFNQNYKEAIYNNYGVYPEINMDLNKPKAKFAPDEYHAFWDEKYAQAFLGKTIEFETQTTTLKGEKKHRIITLHPIYDDNKQVIEVAGQAKDVTQQKIYQQEITNKQSQLSAIINTTDDIIFSVDKEYNISEFNNVLQQVVKIRHGVDIKSGTHVFDILPSDYHEEVRDKYDRAFNGETVLAIEKFNMGDIDRFYEARYNPIKINDEIIGVSVFSKDITDQEESQQKIINAQSQLSAIINNTTDIVVSIDRNYNIVQFNQLLFNMVKYRFGLELKMGMSIFETMDITHHSDMKNIYERVFTEGQSLVAVEMFAVSGSKKRYFESNYNPIKQGSETIGIAIFSRDISEKIESETELRSALKEKEVLLKEVHHRVKNNLQVISSILNLQTSYVKDKETADLLKECQNRIKTMAYIHESLYQTKDFLHINFSEYIINLVKNLFYSYDANQQKIKTIFDVDTIFLNLDTSIPCGLIVNELVSNALKYAFTDGSGGCVTIKIKKLKNNNIEMVVSDNGKGIPENIDYKNTETLGLQLVSILSEQINGTITINRTKGTTFKINF